MRHLNVLVTTNKDMEENNGTKKGEICNRNGCVGIIEKGEKEGVKAAQKAIKKSNNPNVFLDSGKRS